MLEFGKDKRSKDNFNCKELDINRGNISACCKNNTKTAGGFVWKFAKLS